jgi:outer membrane protein assembly factor BamB
VILSSVAASAQTNVRGSLAGTNEYAAPPLRAEPRIAWEVKPRYRDSTSLALSGNVLVTGNTNGRGGTFAYDSSTGKLLWSVPRHIRGEPAIDASAAYAVNDIDNNRFRLSKLDLKSGKPLWSVEAEDLGNHKAAPLVAAGGVFLASRNGTLAGYDAATGKPLWQHEKTRICSPSLAFADGMLLFSGGIAGSPNTLTALDPATGKALWSASPNARDCTEASAVAGGLVLTRVANEIFAFDVKTGALRWKQTVNRVVPGGQRLNGLTELVVSGGVVYTTATNVILGWQLDSGKPVFEFPIELPDVSKNIRMAAVSGVLYFLANAESPRKDANGSGYLYALDVASKQILWKHRTGRPDQYDPHGAWPTQFVLPAGNAIYYENQSLLVKLTQ